MRWNRVVVARRVRPGLIVLVWAAFSSATTVAAPPDDGIDLHWRCAEGGELRDPACWEELRAPQARDRMIFDLADPVTAVGPGYPAILDAAGLDVRSGQVKLQLTRPLRLHAPPLESALTVAGTAGSTARLTLEGNGDTFADPVVSIGGAEGALGTLSLRSWLHAPKLIVGSHGGTAVLRTSSAALFVDDLSIGVGDGSIGEVCFDGQILFAGPVIVGDGGHGCLTVSASLMDVGVTTVGRSSSGTGLLELDHMSIVHFDDLVIGAGGIGRVRSRAGIVTVDTITVGTSSGDGADRGHGEVVLERGGSFLLNTLDLAPSGTATVVFSRTSFFWAVDIHCGAPDDVEVVLEIGDAEDFYIPAFMVNNEMDDLSITVRLIDGFVPSGGEAFFVAFAPFGPGLITFDLPDLPEPLTWAVDRSDGQTMLRVE